MKNKLIIFLLATPFFLSMRCAEKPTSISFENKTEFPIFLFTKQNINFYDIETIQQLDSEKELEIFKIMPDSIKEIESLYDLSSHINETNENYLFYFYKTTNKRGELNKNYDSIIVGKEKIKEGETNNHIIVKDKTIEFLKR